MSCALRSLTWLAQPVSFGIDTVKGIRFAWRCGCAAAGADEHTLCYHPCGAHARLAEQETSLA